MMTRNAVSIALAAATLALAGCAPMTENECRATDWRERGVRDGSHGYHANDFRSFREQCGKFGVAPDERAYLGGRSVGLARYCTAENGLAVGKAGSSYNSGVCPAAAEASFVKNHKIGHEIYSLNGQIRKVDQQINESEKQLKDPALTDDRRRAVRERIRDLDRERARLRQSLNTLESLGVI
jgi:hypothetical protein